MTNKQKIMVVGGLVIAGALFYLLLQDETAIAEAQDIVIDNPVDNFTGNVPSLAFPGINIPPLAYADNVGAYDPTNISGIIKPSDGCCKTCVEASAGNYAMPTLERIVGSRTSSSQVSQQLAAAFGFGAGFGFEGSYRGIF